MKKISVVIPVYNAEDYLLNSVMSVINQTYNNLEIILINDGSKDSSGEICNKLQKKDSRIKVIHKENEGVSKTRNLGIELSTGELISFVDSDDILKPDMYEFLFDNMQSYKADLSICGVQTVYLNKKQQKSKNNSKYATEILNRDQTLRLFLNNDINVGMWTKLVKKEIIKDIRFHEQRRLGEDKYFFFETIIKSKKIVFNNEPKYLYIKRDNSATTSSFDDRQFDIISFSKDMEKTIKNEYPTYLRLAQINTYIEGINLHRRFTNSKNGVKVYKNHYNRNVENIKSNYDNFKNDLYLLKRLELELLLRFPKLYEKTTKLYTYHKFGTT